MNISTNFPELENENITLPVSTLISTTKKTTTTTSTAASEEVAEFDYDDLCVNVSSTAGFRDDPFICNRYIRCNHGYAQKFICSKNTAWDVEKKMCLWLSEVKCEDRELVTDEELLGKNDSDDKMKKRN